MAAAGQEHQDTGNMVVNDKKHKKRRCNCYRNAFFLFGSPTGV